MNKRLSMVCVLAVSVGIAGPALAGLRFSQAVDYYKDSTGAGNAWGMLGTAYNSADTTQWIGCSVSTTSSYQSAWCYATRSDGTQVSCYTSNSQIIAGMRAVPSDVYLTFGFDSSGYCTSVRSEMMSYNQRK